MSRSQATSAQQGPFDWARSRHLASQAEKGSALKTSQTDLHSLRRFRARQQQYFASPRMRKLHSSAFFVRQT
jgi:hypothetical protein